MRFKNSVFSFVLLTGRFKSCYDNACTDKSTLVQKRFRQATSHYLSQCWPRCLSYIWRHWATMSYYIKQRVDIIVSCGGTTHINLGRIYLYMPGMIYRITGWFASWQTYYIRTCCVAYGGAIIYPWWSSQLTSASPLHSIFLPLGLCKGTVTGATGHVSP